MKKKHITNWTKLVLTICFCYSGSLHAQDYSFIHHSVQHGLSHGTVEAIVQDKQGFMWFGTHDGLNKFDGYNFTKYKPASKDFGLNDNVIRCLFVASDSAIWIGTEKGLTRFDPLLNQFKSYYHDPANENSIGGNIVVDILQDKHGVFWIATRGGGLNRFDPAKGVFEKYLPSSPRGKAILHDYVLSLGVYGDKLWVGTEGGLNMIDVNTRKVTGAYSSQLGQNFSDDRIYSLFADDNGIVWLGTWEGGLIRFDPSTGNTKVYMHDPADETSIGSNIVESILQKDQDHLWLATRGGGLNLFNKQSGSFTLFKHRYDKPASINDDNLMSLCYVEPGILWIGTMMGGVDKLVLNKKRFHHYKVSDLSTPEIQLDSKVTSIWLDEDNQDIVWLGTRLGGLLRFNRKQKLVKQFNHAGANDGRLVSENILCIEPYSDPSGDYLWVGHDGPGMNKLNRKTYEVETYRERRRYIAPGKNEIYAEDDSLTNGHVFALETVGDQLWIGMYGTSWGGGVDVLDINQGTFKNYQPIEGNPNSLSSIIVTAITRDSKGNVWVGTRGGGLNKFVAGRGHFIRYQNNQDDTSSILNDVVHCVFEDRSGMIWIGTGGGLNRLNPETDDIMHYTMNDGLPSDFVYGILQDKKGDLWISTGNGLSVFDPKKERFHNYDQQDGLQDNVFIAGSVHQAKDGEMFFGGLNGFNSFYPDSIKHNQHVPPVKITNLKILNQEVPIGEWKGRTILKKDISITEQVTLSYLDRVITLEFAALDYSFPGKNSYQYKLDGLDDQWMETEDGQNFVVFSNLKPGKYAFMVRGANNDNVWNESPAVLHIRIMPPFWQTLAFKISIVTILLIIGLGIFFSKLKSMKKKAAEIEKSAKESILDERNQLRTLIDNMPDFIYIKDIDSRFIVANKKLMKVMGAKTVEELVGKKDSDYYPKDLAKKFEADEKKIMISAKPLINMEEPGLDEHGNPAFISTTKIPLVNQEGIVVGLVGIGRDITELKKAEENLKKHAEELHETNVLLEERQEEIYQQKEEIEAQAEELEATNLELQKLSVVASETDNAVMIISENGEVDWINDGFTRLYGYSLDNISNAKKKYYNFNPTLHKHVARCIKSKKPINYEANIVTKRNQKLWVQTMLTPIRDEKEKVNKVVAIDSDITKVKEAEAEIQVQRDELQKLNATKDKFFSIIAHDLKNPFHAITSFSDLIINNYKDFDDDKKVELIQLIKESSLSAFELLQNLLEWSRTQTDRIKYEPRMFDLYELVKDNVQLVIAGARKKNISINNKISENTEVFADRNMINTVIRNLVSNAIKFTNPYGHVTIEAEKLKEKLKVKVVDNGIGMERDTRDNLFKLKTTASKTGTAGETGTGLGLIVCREFIEKNKGKISVQSEPREGTTFLFTLPLQEK